MVREKHGAKVLGAACLQTLIYIYTGAVGDLPSYWLTYLLTLPPLPLRHPHEYTHRSIAEAQQRQPGVPLQDLELQSLNHRPRPAQFPALAVLFSSSARRKMPSATTL